MFQFRKKIMPALLPSNPGRGLEGKVGFSNAERNWIEHYDVLTALSSVLRVQGHKISIEESWVTHRDSGFILLPQFFELQPLQKGGVRTTTTIQIHHATLVPQGVFEYQHATGENTEDSIRKGFDQWAQSDLVTLLDALQSKPESSTVLRMTVPEKDGSPGYSRRAVLGPVTHFAENPQEYEEQKTPEKERDVPQNNCEHHEFCPRCLLTNSFETFNELFEADTFYGLRLYAARDQDGVSKADCRVNGDDWEKGAEALRRYVSTWPAAGAEFRKQYIVLHTVS